MNENVVKICVNCGAPLHSNKCEYCGTEYGDAPIKGSFAPDSYYGEITINGETFKCYIGNIEIHNIGTDFERDFDGRMKRKRITKRKFTLIEV